ncbi:hypothetical protein ABZ863_33460 [Saccharomonospora sp. NPDC046836]|uniref:hypothetical protein n=1 Tax=Saccharomonospora sp. NPDC046836 TaxID=3156921 RepID=UPI0033F4680F
MREPEQNYQGRPLARPDDEVVDQGPGFDIGALLDRRRALRFLGVGAAGVVLTACGTGSSGSSPQRCAPIPVRDVTQLVVCGVPMMREGPHRPGDTVGPVVVLVA